LANLVAVFHSAQKLGAGVMAAAPSTDIAPRNLADGEPKSGFQKRIDKLVRQRCTLKAENAQLRGDLDRALGIIEKFRKAFRIRKRVNHV
jgi:hypothetical protein